MKETGDSMFQIELKIGTRRNVVLLALAGAIALGPAVCNAQTSAQPAANPFNQFDVKPSKPKKDSAASPKKDIVVQALERGYSIDEIADRIAKYEGIDPAILRERGYSSEGMLTKFGYSVPKPPDTEGVKKEASPRKDNLIGLDAPRDTWIDLDTPRSAETPGGTGGAKSLSQTDNSPSGLFDDLLKPKPSAELAPIEASLQASGVPVSGIVALSVLLAFFCAFILWRVLGKKAKGSTSVTPMTPSTIGLEGVAPISLPVPANGLFAFAGRIGRLSYFWAVLITTVVSVPATVAAQAKNIGPHVWLLVLLALPAIYISTVAGIKRCHDLGKSGWFVSLSLLPGVNVVFNLYLLFTKGMAGSNKYGPPPNTDGVVHQSSAQATGTSYDSWRAASSTAEPTQAPATPEIVSTFGTKGTTPATEPIGQPDEAMWADAMNEFDSASRRSGLYARAFAEAQGNEAATKANYLRYRAGELEQAYQLQVAERQHELVQEEAERVRKLEEAQALEAQRVDLSLPKGRCPNSRCKAVIPLASQKCPKCAALFEVGSTWSVRPLEP